MWQLIHRHQELEARSTMTKTSSITVVPMPCASYCVTHHTQPFRALRFTACNKYSLQVLECCLCSAFLSSRMAVHVSENRCGATSAQPSTTYHGNTADTPPAAPLGSPGWYWLENCWWKQQTQQRPKCGHFYPETLQREWRKRAWSATTGFLFSPNCFRKAPPKESVEPLGAFLRKCLLPSSVYCFISIS